MKSKNFYEILGVDIDATKDEIETAYNDVLTDLYVKRNSGEISKDEYSELFDELDEAHDTLIDDEKRHNYDEALKKGCSKEKGKGKGKKAVTGAIAGTLALSLLAGGLGYYLGTRNTGAHLTNPVSVSDEKTTLPTETVSDTEETVTTETTEEKTQTALEVTSNLPELVNYGDINDAKLVEERAQNIKNQFDAAGLYNFATNAPYTLDEIKDVIYYINGAYVPTDELDAIQKVDEFLNMCLAPLNTEAFINAVNYQGGEDSFKPMVEQTTGPLAKVEFVKNTLFGDSTVGPYLLWIEDHYDKILTTTDREEGNRLYNEVFQSLADFSFGDGFELDGKVYKEGMALGTDKVNSGNVLQMLVYMFEPFRTGKANDYYTTVDKHISANPEENKVNIPYLQISEWYTPLCEYEHYEFDDEGYLLIDQNAVPEAGIEERIQDGRNFASINQMNTANELLERLYSKDKATEKKLTK